MSDQLDHQDVTGIRVDEQAVRTKTDTSSDRDIHPPEAVHPFDAPTGGAGDPGGGADPDFPIPGRGPKTA